MATISGIVKDDTGTAVAARTVRAYRRDTGALLGGATTGDGQAVPGDEHYNSVSLLLHCDGANGSTTFTDHSPSPKTVTASGNAQISTAQSKFGGASAVFDGSGDYLSAPAHAGFVFGVGDFTVELWINTTTTAEKILVDQFESGSTNSWQLAVKNGRLSWYSGGYVLTGTTAVNNGAWHHVAAVRSAGTLRFFVDGVLDGSVSLAYNFGTSLVFGIGAQVATRNPAYDFPGYIDELRITKGVARYTANFTPPAAAFPNNTPVAAVPIGAYTIDTGAYTGECNVIALDDAAGTTYNDLILRTTPV